MASDWSGHRFDMGGGGGGEAEKFNGCGDRVQKTRGRGGVLLLLQEIDKIIIGHIAHQYYTTDMQLINTLSRIRYVTLYSIDHALSLYDMCA